MICFKDRTFCSAKCKTTDCFRNWNANLQAEAERWAAGFIPKGEPIPVAWSDFSETCPDYEETTK